MKLGRSVAVFWSENRPHLCHRKWFQRFCATALIDFLIWYQNKKVTQQMPDKLILYILNYAYPRGNCNHNFWKIKMTFHPIKILLRYLVVDQDVHACFSLPSNVHIVRVSVPTNVTKHWSVTNRITVEQTGVYLVLNIYLDDQPPAFQLLFCFAVITKM